MTSAQPVARSGEPPEGWPEGHHAWPPHLRPWGYRLADSVRAPEVWPGRFTERLRRAAWQDSGEVLTRAQRRRRRRAEAAAADGTGRPCRPGPAASSLLEPIVNEVEPSPGRAVIRLCNGRCRRHVCPCCGKIIGYHARHRMMERLGDLGREHGREGDLQMWTLTVDPKRYAGPREAWADVGSRRRIGETMRAMGLRWYVVVLEWHESGWPHWHVLVWQPVEVMRIEKRAMESAWGLGMVRYRCRRRDGEGRWTGTTKPMAWAVRYVTKYLTKGEGRAPEWVGGLSHVRMVWASREWGPVVRGSAASEVDITDEVRADLPGDDEIGVGMAGEDEHPWRTNREAVASCGASVRVVRQRITDAGEVAWDYIGEAAVPFRFVRRLVDRVGGKGAAGRSMASVKLWEGSEAWERVRATLRPGRPGQAPLLR